MALFLLQNGNVCSILKTQTFIHQQNLQNAEITIIFKFKDGLV